MSADPLFISNREQLAALAVRYTLPTMFNAREFAFCGWTFELRTRSS